MASWFTQHVFEPTFYLAGSWASSRGTSPDRLALPNLEGGRKPHEKEAMHTKGLPFLASPLVETCGDSETSSTLIGAEAT